MTLDEGFAKQTHQLKVCHQTSRTCLKSHPGLRAQVHPSPKHVLKTHLDQTTLTGLQLTTCRPEPHSVTCSAGARCGTAPALGATTMRLRGASSSKVPYVHHDVRVPGCKPRPAPGRHVVCRGVVPAGERGESLRDHSADTTTCASAQHALH